MRTERQIIAYKRYFLDFYEELPENVQAKIEWTLNLIQVTNQDFREITLGTYEKGQKLYEQ